jgi:ABC-type transport system substrate-binding protein
MTMRAVVAFAALAACASPDRAPRFKAAGSTTPRDGGSLRFAIQNQVQTLDPTFGYDDNIFLALHPLFDTLVDFSPTAEVIPRLATSWTVSPDGLVYRFALRPDATFSDGTPITAAHFKYSLERTLTASGAMVDTVRDIAGAANAIVAAELLRKLFGPARAAQATCAGITTDGDHVLVITLARVNPALLKILALPFATPQRREHVEARGRELSAAPDATGPFELASWDRGNRLVLRRNRRYYDPARAHVDELVLYENLPRDTQFQMFERGELDAAPISAADYLSVINEPAWQPLLHYGQGLNAFGSRMNVQRAPFTDRRVRQALNYALDKAHTARVLNGITVAAHGILPPGIFGRADLAPYPHDVARARELLREAGYPDGFDVDYLTTNDEETENVAGSLQSDLAEVGVRVHIATTGWSTYGTAIEARDGPAFSYGVWLADYPDPTSFFDQLFRSGVRSNTTFYANPELDDLLDAARAELDVDRRQAMYAAVEQILYDDAPWIWDYHRKAPEVVQPYVRNYEPHPIWLRDYTAAWLDVGPDGQPVAR